jgi:hypothetical protein
MLKKSSALKLLGQMEPNLAGSIYVRSSIKFGSIKKLYSGPYIDAFCQAWFHLAQLFQRRRLKCEKLMDGRWTPSDGNIWKCVGLYRMSEYSGFILVNKNTLGP